MSNEVAVSDQVKRFVEGTIARNGLKPTANVKYQPGSELGDGYTSKTIVIDIEDGTKSLHLFLKLPMGLEWQERLPFHKLFANEIFWYNTVYPAYRSFLKEKGVEDGFRNAPKCYGLVDTERKEVIALENLKRTGFTLFRKVMNEHHIILAMKTFAKLHAVSFAFKDQRRELHNTFVAKIHDCFGDFMASSGFMKMYALGITEFLKSLDPVDDKLTLDGSVGLEENMVDILLHIEDHSNEYSTITQGDCWCNNMLFLYEKGVYENPKDIMLVDWQLLRNGSPAIDLCYFFYVIATELTIENYDRYRKIYHEELSERIRQLGSDPELLYPFSVLEKEWRKFAKFGLAMAFFIVKSVLMEKEERPDFEKFPEKYKEMMEAAEKGRSTMPILKNEDIYNARLKTVLEHMLKNEFL